MCLCVDEVKEYFMSYGNVKDVTLKFDRETGKSRLACTVCVHCVHCGYSKLSFIQHL